MPGTPKDDDLLDVEDVTEGEEALDEYLIVECPSNRTLHVVYGMRKAGKGAPNGSFCSGCILPA